MIDGMSISGLLQGSTSLQAAFKMHFKKESILSELYPRISDFTSCFIGNYVRQKA